MTDKAHHPAQTAASSETMDGFARRRERSKADIRQAAWALFSQFGVEKVSVADIADKAGVVPATIYNNFGTKGALVREFVKSVVDQLVAQAEAALAQATSYRARMSALLDFIAERLADPEPSVVDTTVFTGSADLPRDPEIANIRDAARARMTALLLDLAHEGQAAGQVPAYLSDAALGIYFRAWMESFTDPELPRRAAQDPTLVRDLGVLMRYGLHGTSSDEESSTGSS
jgi:AcrR family transcriptional regulator